ncbi:hypothetical protein LMG28690_01702 [Paraburkholderia caffeinilytica]|nr:hypothetical protein LMG28690_01702 [Paraburkholderia caffeinilytica]
MAVQLTRRDLSMRTSSLYGRFEQGLYHGLQHA